MKLFRHHHGSMTDHSRRLYALYEIAYTAVDFLAGLTFVIGSVLFFWPAYEHMAIWFFVVGSVLFCLRPSIRMAREIHLWRRGQIETLAKRVDD